MFIENANGLYRLKSEAKTFEWVDQVQIRLTIDWFITEREKPPEPYEIVVKDYQPWHWDSIWAEEIVDECFALYEAEAVKSYIDEADFTDHFETTLHAVSVPLMLPTKHMPFKFRKQDNRKFPFDLYERKTFPFDYKVVGYVDASGYAKYNIPLWWTPMG